MLVFRAIIDCMNKFSTSSRGFSVAGGVVLLAVLGAFAAAQYSSQVEQQAQMAAAATPAAPTTTQAPATSQTAEALKTCVSNSFTPLQCAYFETEEQLTAKAVYPMWDGSASWPTSKKLSPYTTYARPPKWKGVDILKTNKVSDFAGKTEAKGAGTYLGQSDVQDADEKDKVMGASAACAYKATKKCQAFIEGSNGTLCAFEGVPHAENGAYDGKVEGGEMVDMRAGGKTCGVSFNEFVKTKISGAGALDAVLQPSAGNDAAMNGKDAGKWMENKCYPGGVRVATAENVLQCTQKALPQIGTGQTTSATTQMPAADQSKIKGDLGIPNDLKGLKDKNPEEAKKLAMNLAANKDHFADLQKIACAAGPTSQECADATAKSEIANKALGDLKALGIDPTRLTPGDVKPGDGNQVDPNKLQQQTRSPYGELGADNKNQPSPEEKKKPEQQGGGGQPEQKKDDKKDDTFARQQQAAQDCAARGGQWTGNFCQPGQNGMGQNGLMDMLKNLLGQNQQNQNQNQCQVQNQSYQNGTPCPGGTWQLTTGASQNTISNQGGQVYCPTLQCVPSTNASQPCGEQPKQPEASSCSGTLRAVYGTGATASCVVGWNCSTDGGASSQTTATLSCKPATVDVGKTVTINYACPTGSTAKSSDFSTDNDSPATVTISELPEDKTATFMLKCMNGNSTVVSKSCSVQVAKPTLTLAATPTIVSAGQSTTITVLGTAMKSCTVLAAPQVAGFPQNITFTGDSTVSVQAASLSENTVFTFRCVTQGNNQFQDQTVAVNVNK